MVMPGSRCEKSDWPFDESRFDQVCLNAAEETEDAKGRCWPPQANLEKMNGCCHVEKCYDECIHYIALLKTTTSIIRSLRYIALLAFSFFA